MRPPAVMRRAERRRHGSRGTAASAAHKQRLGRVQRVAAGAEAPHQDAAGAALITRHSEAVWVVRCFGLSSIPLQWTGSTCRSSRSLTPNPSRVSRAVWFEELQQQRHVVGRAR